jgi:hypothetical protein
MSGIVDDSGQQWERCNGCGTFTRFPQALGYEKPKKATPYGRMLCVKCANTAPNIRAIKPAPEWRAVYGR